ncbi:hypothetical protein BDA99DRAFT_555073 [Phascolomyces articulosus]|uniref:Uncharacterized protein n=1 Tax=Phascolomyces articulosus TaxID=60185 RepID=A0AAD5PLN1_9FUNG|nr:hypothetical protein BDA99DRAFT_555073 [Phascolomyces articulosus]
MPITTGTLLALGAAGFAGAAAYKSNKNKQQRQFSQQQQQQQQQPQTTNDISPLVYGRRGSGTIQNDGYDPAKQPELFWRRNNGINFSHNADKKFPVDVQQEQSS